jgi:hypothetical protein
MEENKRISYKTGLGELIVELIFYFIFLILFFLSFYVSYWVGIYLFIILFLVFRKSNKILAVNDNEMIILKYFFIKQRINIENIKIIYCKRTKLRFVSFVDVCVIFLSNDKDCSAHFISYNFFGYVNLLGLLNYFNDKIYIDKDSFKIINILYMDNKFVSI